MKQAMLALLLALPVAAQHVTIGADGAAQVTMMGEGPRLEALTLRVVDGRRGEPAGDGIGIDWSAQPLDGAVGLPVTVTNRGAAQAWVEVTVTGTVVGGPERLWTGRVEQPAGEAFELAGPRGIFPLAAAWSPARLVGLGIAPDEWLSWLRQTWTPAPGGGTLGVGTRLVLDPGQAETVTFLLLATPGEYGIRHGIERYQALFPETFVPTPGIDPRVAGNGATYQAWTGRPQPENCRRLRAGWEWVYAPFRRTGDAYGREELYEYEPARPISNYRNVPPAEFREWRRARLENGTQCDVAMMFYVPAGIWCEVSLAEQRYPEAISHDAKVKTLFTTPWVTGHDNEVRVFPGAEPYASVLREDMRRIVEENPVRGFAFDTAEGGARWQHEQAVTYPRGRAWDEEGVYVDEGVGVAELIDFVHTLKKDGLTMAVVGNPTATSSYLTAMRCDSGMFEAVPWHQHGGVGNDLLRYLMGSKTLVWWEEWLLEKQVDWQVMAPAEIRAAYAGLADYAILESLRVGALPTPRLALGTPKLVVWTEILTDLVQRGWQPVPALSGLPGLERARYGEATIGLGNKTGATIAGTVALQAKYLPDARVRLLAPYGGGELKQVVEAGETRFAVELPSRAARVYEPRASLPGDWVGEAQARFEPGLPEAVLTIDLTGKPGSTVVAPVVPPDFTLKALSLNDRPESLDAPLTLTGRDRIVYRFRSRTFGDDAAQVLGYPLLEDRPAQVVAPAELDPAAILVAQFIAKAAVGRGQPEPEVPVARTAGDGPAVVLALGQRGVTVADGPLRISGATPAEVLEVVRRLLVALEPSYPYAGPFPQSDAADRAGLTGGTLTPVEGMYQAAMAP